MNYKKVSNLILNKWFKGEKILYQHIDGGCLFCIDNMLVVNIPDVFNIFNAGLFEPADLSKIIDSIKEWSELAYFTGVIRRNYRDNLYEVQAEKGRKFYIDTKTFNQLGIDNPLFEVSCKTDCGPLLVYDERGNIPEVKAVICPVKL